MYTHGTRLLGDTRNWLLHLTTRSHHKITVLIDNNHDIRHEAVSLGWQQLLIEEFLVILLDRAHRCKLQQLIAVIHLHTERLERTHHFVDIGNDGLIFAIKLRKEVFLEYAIEAELDHLGVYHHELEVCRVHLVKQRCNYRIKTYRLTHTGSTRNKQVRHLGHIYHINLIRDSLSQRKRQRHVGLLVLAAVQQ